MWCDLHCNQNISKTNCWIHKLSCLLNLQTSKWKLAMSFWSIFVNISSSLEVETKWSLLEEEEWLLLEKYTREKCLGEAFCYIALIKLLSYTLESSILPGLHLSPLLLSWFVFHHSTFTLKKHPKITCLGILSSLAWIHVTHPKP